jgi:hypothetical protein
MSEGQKCGLMYNVFSNINNFLPIFPCIKWVKLIYKITFYVKMGFLVGHCFPSGNTVFFAPLLFAPRDPEVCMSPCRSKVWCHIRFLRTPE